jgi:hypothetical protein
MEVVWPIALINRVAKLSTITTLSFPPTNLLGLGSQTHQSITGMSLTELDKELFQVSQLNASMRRALYEIITANAAVDHDQTHSALHFDGENFAGGQERLVGLFEDTIAKLVAGDVPAARLALGSALHTVQDFYAHSNWIELGNLGPSPDLGRPGHVIGRTAAPDEITCVDGVLATSSLTSGYYAGEDRSPQIPGKCRHGGPFDRSPGSGGINKDFRITLLSPQSAYHDAAANAAAAATKHFVLQVRDPLPPGQIDLLLGR